MQNSSYDLNFHRVLGRGGGGETTYPSDPWVRPSEWDDIASLIGPTDEKMILLMAVFDTGDLVTNFAQVRCTCVGGFTVDWGDGTTDSVATNTNIVHYYDYDDVGLTSTSYGYKTAIMTVTPTGANPITAVVFNTAAPTNIRAFSVLSLDARLPSCTSFAPVAIMGTSLAELRLRENDITSLSTAFTNFYNLRKVYELDSPLCTTFSTCFSGCTALETIENFDTSGGVTFTSMFQNCYNLKEVPLLDTSSGVTFTSMFNSCRSLLTVPLFDTSSGQTFTSMFQACHALIEVPLFDTSAGITFTSMFATCYTIRTIPLFDLSAGTTFTTMFSGCSSLRSVPAYDFSAATTLAAIFVNCQSLEEIGAITTDASCTNFSQMFNNCLSLRTVPLFDTSGGTNFSNMFDACVCLVDVPAFDFSAATNLTSLFANVATVRRIQATFPNNLSFSVAQLSLSGPALDEIYTNLPTASGSRTITVSSNIGVATDTPSIATAKGWTVTG